VVALNVALIDSQRMLLRVEQGKGQRDRYSILSPRLLEVLRTWWLFPGRRVNAHPSGPRARGSTNRQTKNEDLAAGLQDTRDGN
jgi:integrase